MVEIHEMPCDVPYEGGMFVQPIPLDGTCVVCGQVARYVQGELTPSSFKQYLCRDHAIERGWVPAKEEGEDNKDE